MSTSTVPSTSLAPQARRRRPAADEFPATAAGYRGLLKWARKPAW
ncbi:hypothetical protein [Streptomyces sp. NPDC021622]